MGVLLSCSFSGFTPASAWSASMVMLCKRSSGICMTGLLDEVILLETCHVKGVSDIRDDALLVPKLVLVGQYMAGRKHSDSDGDEGQLDAILYMMRFMNWEVCAINWEVSAVNWEVYELL